MYNSFMLSITDKIGYYWDSAEDAVGAINQRLNLFCDGFTENMAIPAIKGTYNKVGQVVPSFLANRWYDPFSSNFILRITKIVERIALWHALKKPGSSDTFPLPFYSRYLDTVLISGAQHLHNYIKEVNFLLSLPATLKYYTTAPSFDSFISKLPNFFGKSWVVVSKVIIAIKYLILNLMNFILKALEIGFSTFSLEGLFYLIKNLREVINAASMKLSAKVTEVAQNVIDRREREVRRELTISITNIVNSFAISTLSRIVVKSVLGGALFYGKKFALQSTLEISDQPIHYVGLFILGSILWKTVLKPTWDPYYHSYIHNFDPKISHLREFCQRYDISYWYPSLKTIQIYQREAPLDS